LPITCDHVFQNKQIALQLEFFGRVKQPFPLLDEFIADIGLILQNNLSEAKVLTADREALVSHRSLLG
jgi:hypothetical protein